ncbi:hypothetical protein Tco_1412157 [Tanacetum coccineum]
MDGWFSFFRLPDFDVNRIDIVSSYVSSGWSWTSQSFSQITTGWSGQSLRGLDTWIVDELLWNVVVVVESVVLTFMLGCYFIFCGCTL